MIIANLNYSSSELIKRVDNFEELCKYIRSTVPEEYRHVDAIYHNTRYYLNTRVLEDSSIPLNTKKKLSDALTTGLRTVGVLGDWVTCGELNRRANMEKINKYRKGDKHGKGS